MRVIYFTDYKVFYGVIWVTVKDRCMEFLSIMDDCTDSYMYVYDMTNDYLVISEKALEKLSIETNLFDNALSCFSEVVYPADIAMLVAALQGIMNHKSSMLDLEFRCIDIKGNILWVSCKGKIRQEANGESLLLVGSITEIGKKNKYDNTTSLYSESVLESDFDKLVSEGSVTGYMLLIGVDNFKRINEKYGVSMGDRVLADVARCIVECFDDAKRVYRLKGDEFAVLCTCDAKEALAEAKDLYKQIRSRVDYCIEKEHFHMFYTISGGAYSFDTSTDNLNDVFNGLRFALHNAKINGRNTFAAYSDDKFANYIRRMDIQEELRSCIINDFEGFELYYQPVVRASTRQIRGAEALIRWNSKSYGFMSPGEFIPLLEESALIIPLGKWIIEQAVIQCKEWVKVIPDFVMNVNLSFVQIIKSDILKDVIECVDYYGLDHSHIVFEATESGELESKTAVKNVLNSFSENSFQLAIDDFGTGYSNLRYIKDMMFNIIKIDRLFIQDIDKCKDNYTLVKYVIDMAHSLNIRICVEGVETEEELEKVMTLSPDCIQGYYYGKPMPSVEFASRFICA